MSAALTDARTEVVILGGGPAGLTAAIALGRLGVDCIVLERRGGTSDHPRGHVENGRTMELFRLWGVEDDVRAQGVPRDFLKSVTFVTRISGIELGRLEFDPDSEWLMTNNGAGPASMSSTPQDRLEPILLAKAESTGHATVHFGVVIDEVTQDDGAVTVKVTGADGAAHTITADYCIAADGPRSQTRESLGLEMEGPGTLGTQLGIYFHADLSKYTKPNPNILYWIYNTDAQGVIISLDGDQRWHMLSAYDSDREKFEDFTQERVLKIVRAAVGDPDIEIDIRSILPWRMRAAVAQTTRVGRIFIAGDAAHTMPPTGGMGMNTAIGDTHNLAWKIQGVLRGWAGPELLDSYQIERVPVGMRNTFNSLENAKTMMETGLAGILVNDPEGFAHIEDDEGAALRATLGEAAARQHDHFSFDGLSFGYTYEAGALVQDGTPEVPSGVGEYVPTARPGARAPHVWMERDGQKVSTVDLSDNTFVVLAAGTAWADAAAAAGEALGAPIVGYAVGRDLTDTSGSWAELYEVGTEGAVLIRPDGHVAWRSASGSADPAGELTAALTSVLSR